MKIIPLLIVLITFAGCGNNRSFVKTGLEGKPLPNFTFMLMDSVSRLSTSNIPTGKPIVVFFFSPSCPYCRAQTEDLIKNIQSLGDIRFYLLAQLPFAPVRKYYTHYQLEKYTNITLGLDYETYFGKYYKANAVPYIAIFNKEKQLKHVLVGNVGSKTIKEIAFE